MFNNITMKKLFNFGQKTIKKFPRESLTESLIERAINYYDVSFGTENIFFYDSNMPFPKKK